MADSTATSPDLAPYNLSDFPLSAAPQGEVTAVFVQGVWGKRTNLMSCFVTGEDPQVAFRLSTFARQDYAPYENGPNMRYARNGQSYKLKIGRSAKGQPTLLQAELIDG